MKKFLLSLIVSGMFLNGMAFADEKKDAPKKEEKHDHDDLLKIGDVGFLKMAHDDDKGTVTVELFQVDKKTALVIEGDLKLNATVGSEKKDFVLKAKDGKYEITDEFLKKEFGGRFSLKSGSKQYIVKIMDHDDHHGHKH